MTWLSVDKILKASLWQLSVTNAIRYRNGICLWALQLFFMKLD